MLCVYVCVCLCANEHLPGRFLRRALVPPFPLRWPVMVAAPPPDCKEGLTKLSSSLRARGPLRSIEWILLCVLFPPEGDACFVWCLLLLVLLHLHNGCTLRCGEKQTQQRRRQQQQRGYQRTAESVWAVQAPLQDPCGRRLFCCAVAAQDSSWSPAVQ